MNKLKSSIKQLSPKYGVLLLLAAPLFSACATAPKNITPQIVSTAHYRSLGCEAIGSELARYGEAMVVANDDQKKARLSDAFSILFTGLPMSTFTGANKASYIGLMKGEIEAMHRVSAVKGCTNASGTSAVSGASTITAPS